MKKTIIILFLLPCLIYGQATHRTNVNIKTSATDSLYFDLTTYADGVGSDTTKIISSQKIQIDSLILPTITGNIIPSANATYDLGAVNYYWDTLYIQDIKNYGSASLDGSVVINESSNAVNTRIESNGNANMVFVDGTNDKVGIGDPAPNQIIGVLGTNAQISLEESDTEFLRLGVGETSNRSNIGWDDGDTLQIGVYSSPTDITISSLVNITPGGFVGIGTATPTEKLTLYSAGDNIILKLKSGDPDVWINFADNNTSGSNYNLIGATGDQLNFRAGNIDFMKLTTTGLNLGDDANNASGKLAFIASDGDLSNILCNTSDALTFNDAGGGYIFDGVITANTGFAPDAHDGSYLGTSALGFSDLFLATGGVITWGAASTPDLTLTHSANNLTLAGGDFTVSGNILAGATTYNIGATGTRFNLAWFDTVHANVFTGSNIVISESGSDVTFNADTVTISGILWDGSSVIDGELIKDNHDNLYTSLSSSFSGSGGSYTNILLGEDAGNSLTTGDGNLFIGSFTGDAATTGYYNIAIGANSATTLTEGYRNILFGEQTGYDITTGSDNICIGTHAGHELTVGAKNIFIGYYAGYQETTDSNLLYIDNSNSSDPLIYGDFASDSLEFNGNVNITGNLWVLGTYPSDFVFTKDYKLKSLDQQITEAYSLGYLPAFKTRNRNNLGEYIGGLEEEVEKLYLYINELEKRLTKLENK